MTGMSVSSFLFSFYGSGKGWHSHLPPRTGMPTKKRSRGRNLNFDRREFSGMSGVVFLSLTTPRMSPGDIIAVRPRLENPHEPGPPIHDEIGRTGYSRSRLRLRPFVRFIFFILFSIIIFLHWRTSHPEKKRCNRWRPPPFPLPSFLPPFHRSRFLV